MTRGTPILLVTIVLLLASGVALIIQEPPDTEDVVTAFMLLSGGLITLGAWLAVEILGIKQSFIARRSQDTTSSSGDTEEGA